MMQGWNRFNEELKKGNGLFVKLDDGDTVEGVFMGEPHVYYSKYQDNNEYTEWQPGLSFRFKINFLSRDEKGNIKAKIFEGGKKVGRRIKYLLDEQGPDCVYKIKREGKTKDDTTYHIDFKTKLTEEQFNQMKSIKLNELGSSEGFKDLGADRPIPDDLDYSKVGQPQDLDDIPWDK